MTLVGPHGFRGRIPLYPPTPGSLLAVAGLDVATDGALYLFDEASGNLIDHSGNGRDLIVGGAPTFGDDRNGHRGIYYPALTAKHVANVISVGAGESCLFGTIASFADAVHQTHVWGQFSTGVAYAMLYWAGPTTLNWRAVSGATVSIAITGVVKDNEPYFVGGQIDRSGPTMRILAARRGVAIKGSASASGVGAVTDTFGVNAYAAANSVHHDYGFVAKGAQCEGATVLDSVAAKLGFL